DAEQAGAPGRVVAAHLQGPVAESGAARGRRPAGTRVAGGQGLGAAFPQAPQEVANRAGGEAEGGSDGGGGLPALAALPEGAAEGHGDRGGHGRPPKQRATRKELTPVVDRGKTRCRY